MDNVSNDNSGNLGPSLLAVEWLFTVISTLVVALRLYVRLRVLRKFNIDDCMIIITLLCAIGNAIFITIAVSWGFGKHMSSLASNPIAVMNSIKWSYLCEFFLIMTPQFGRISYAFLLSNLIPPSKSRRTFLWVLVGIHFVVDVVMVVVSFAQCRPFRGFWDRRIGADCWPPTIQLYTSYAQGSLGSVVDLVMAMFPCSLFWNLNMHWKQKAFLSSIMGLGVFAMIASIVKTVELQALAHTNDLTYFMARLIICATLEGHLVLLSASIPTVTPIFKPPGTCSNNRSGRVDNMNTFLSWKHAQATKSKGSRGPFEPLQDHGLTTEIIVNEEQKIPQSNAYLPRILDVGDTSGSVTGIRKDITVSITFNSRS
ncbi:hypothetical protein F4815DRAFT_502682 [Daldinia loculata]|nr:hypothetical protein F4815DRAFT_502682 [Daldinia loculata]